MKRKTIAVCVTGFNWENESRIINGIYEQCRKFDINLLVFAAMVRKPEFNSEYSLPKNVILGETEIFELINYDTADGIIILGESIIDENVISSVHEKAKARGIPVININDPGHKLDKNIILSDHIAMEFIVRHLVEDHGLKKINFIGGFPGNIQTEERLSAYKKVLSEHGIPIEESRISYGEFWKKAYECTEDIIKSGDIPEAIVCASDTMAFFCMDCLKSNGYSIPDDIIVTGFDGISDCEAYSPSLTTARLAFQEAGEKAVEIFADIWNGRDTDDTVYVNSVLFRQQSCGCVKPGDKVRFDFYSERYGELNTYKEFNYHLITLNTIFANAENSAELYEAAHDGAVFFKLKELYICVCPDVERVSKTIGETEKGYKGISEKMLSMYSFGGNVPAGTEFRSADYAPEDILNGEEACFYAFSSMYFKDRYIGYVAYQPSKVKGFGDFFATWLLALSNNAGSFYMQNDLKYVVDELENLYIRDPLTGLYNRRGMDKLKYGMIEQARSLGGFVTIICADIDNLKPINDLYGHEAGDNAILRTANAIEASMPKGSICTRTGGDEFCIILSHENEDDVNRFIEQIDKFLADYNKISGLPYKIGCSCGYSSIHSDRIVSLENMMTLADEDMYRVKARRKTNRAIIQ